MLAPIAPQMELRASLLSDPVAKYGTQLLYHLGTYGCKIEYI